MKCQVVGSASNTIGGNFGLKAEALTSAVIFLQRRKTTTPPLKIAKSPAQLQKRKNAEKSAHAIAISVTENDACQYASIVENFQVIGVDNCELCSFQFFNFI